MQSQYLHTAKYGNPGGFHTMKPMFKKTGDHIFKSEYHPDVVANGEEAHKAIYHVKGNKVYATGEHPDGASPHAIFTITDKGTIHTTMDHPEHQNGLAVYVLDHRPDPKMIEQTIANEIGTDAGASK